MKLKLLLGLFFLLLLVSSVLGVNVSFVAEEVLTGDSVSPFNVTISQYFGRNLTADAYYTLDANSFANSGAGGATWALTNSGTTNTSGVLNDGRNFDGTNDLIISSNSNLLDVADFSINMWIKGNTLNKNQYLFTHFDSTPNAGEYNHQIRITSANNLVVELIDKDNEYSLSIPFSSYLNDEWVFISAVMDGSDFLKVYINGNLVATNTTFTIRAYSARTQNIRFGGHANVANYWFTGVIDEISIFPNGILTTDEIMDLYIFGKYYGLYNDSEFPINLSAGSYNVTVSAEGYFPITEEITVNEGLEQTITINDLGNARLNLNATNAYTGNLITGFNGWIYNHEYDINVSYSTTTDSYTKDLLAGNYTVYLTATNYSITSANTQNISIASEATETLTFDLYTTNSVLISIYNDTTTNLLTQNVSITAIYGTSSFSRWTTNGTIYIDLLTPANYELRFASQDHNFSTGTYYFTVLNDSTTTINVYLIPNASLEIQRVLVVNDVSSALSGAIVRLQKEEATINGLWVTVDEKTSGNDGYTGFFVKKSISDYYRFIVIYEGVTRLTTTKTLFLPNVDEIITLQISIIDDSERTIYDSITTDFEWGGTNNETFTFSWSDGNSIISGAKITVHYKDYNITNTPAELLYNITSTLTSGELTYTLPVVNDSEFIIRAYILTNEREDLYFLTTKIFGITMVVNKDLGLLLAIIVFSFVAFITISLKPLFSTILSFSVLAIMNAFQLISVPVTVITSFIALAVIFFIKLKGGNS